MVVINNPEVYKLLGFEKYKGKANKKYIAILENTKTKQKKQVPFGDSRYQQYFDTIGEYRSLDHNDPKRRELYRKRHRGEELRKFSSGYFSWHYLW